MGLGQFKSLARLHRFLSPYMVRMRKDLIFFHVAYTNPSWAISWIRACYWINQSKIIWAMSPYTLRANPEKLMDQMVPTHSCVLHQIKSARTSIFPIFNGSGAIHKKRDGQRLSDCVFVDNPSTSIALDHTHAASIVRTRRPVEMRYLTAPIILWKRQPSWPMCQVGHTKYEIESKWLFRRKNTLNVKVLCINVVGRAAQIFFQISESGCWWMGHFPTRSTNC